MSRAAVRTAPVVVLARLAAGCNPGRSDIEGSIRTEMKEKMGVAIQSFDLTKQADGGYTGTATAANGDVYDVAVESPKDGKTAWKAVPGPAMVEREVRQGLEAQLSTKVKSLRLTRVGLGVYSNPAELASGDRVTVKTQMQGAQLVWSAEPAAP